MIVCELRCNLIICIHSCLLRVLLRRAGRPQLCLHLQLTRSLWSFLTTTTTTSLPHTRFCLVWLVLLLRLGVDDMPTPIPRGKGSKLRRMRLLQRLRLSAKPRPRQPALWSPRRRKAASPGQQITPPRTCSALLAILSERLPIGGKAWNSCTDEYNIWAEENGRPIRTAKSLEAKYKQVYISHACNY